MNMANANSQFSTGKLKVCLSFSFSLTALLLLASSAFAQSSADDSQTQTPSDNSDEATTIFNHSQTSRFWVSGQFNTILQWHPSFPAKYSGPNSLRPEGENATSRVMTLYMGMQITHSTELFFDLESAGGRGISDALGAAGFTNLDVVRNPTLGSTPYLARLMIRQIIPLSSETVEAERGPFTLATKLPARRLEVRVGKFSTVDFFDVNSVGSDSHLQFMNWTVDNNGAFDYAADTRGYTYGLLLEYEDKRWALRFAECLMPKVANGINLDLNLSRARGENLELELRRNFLPHRAGILRLLAYANHANMGNYREAINAFLNGRDATLDITAHRQQGRVKYGFGLNIEQEVADGLRVFGRFGWNEGKNESFAYTEVDNTVEAGADLRGTRWKRKLDKVGLAFVSNGISKDHRTYLALGGQGFLLGDGGLTYGRETIFETYYTAHLWRGIFSSLDLQHVANPGYNKDRGPVLAPAFRMHVDF
jgi:high affinity Mn2+ porin